MQGAKNAYTRPVLVEKWSCTRTLADHNTGYRAEIDERIFNYAIFYIVFDWIFFSMKPKWIIKKIDKLKYTMKFSEKFLRIFIV